MLSNQLVGLNIFDFVMESGSFFNSVDASPMWIERTFCHRKAYIFRALKLNVDTQRFVQSLLGACSQ